MSGDSGNLTREDVELVGILSTNVAPDDPDWKSFPLYYQVMLMTQEGLVDKETHLERRGIQPTQARRLNDLIEPDGLVSALQRFEQYKDWHLPVAVLTKLQQKAKEEAERLKKIKSPSWQKEFEKNHKNLHDTWSGIEELAADAYVKLDQLSLMLSVDEALGTLQEAFEVYHNQYMREKYQGKQWGKSKNALMKNIKQNPNNKYLKACYFNRLCIREDMVDEILRLKIERTEALQEIDEMRARAYLFFVPRVFQMIRVVGNQSLLVDSVDAPFLYAYAKADTEIYNSVLQSFYTLEVKVVEPTPEPEPQPHPEPVTYALPTIQKPQPKPVPIFNPDEYFESLYGAMIKEKRNGVGADVKDAALDFALEVAESETLSPEQKQAFYHSINGFDDGAPLNRTLLRKKPDQQKFDLFLGRMQDSIAQGEVPDVHRCYRQTIG